MVVTENGAINLGGPRVKNLLTVTAVIEGAGGLVLLLIPSTALRLLLGSSLDSPQALTFARWAALILCALGVGCWLVRRDGENRVARGLISAMLFYNAGIAAILVYAGIGLGLSGKALWPLVLLHAVMTCWCIMCLAYSQAKIH